MEKRKIYNLVKKTANTWKITLCIYSSANSRHCLLTFEATEGSLQVDELTTAQTFDPLLEGRKKGVAMGRYKPENS